MDSVWEQEKPGAGKQPKNAEESHLFRERNIGESYT